MIIKDIKLDKVASYKNPVNISGLKRFNFFYGLNGTGKSTLARYLADIENHSGSFTNCNLTPCSSSRQYEVLVYNQEFIDENFRQEEKFPGIFTLKAK